MSIQRDLAQLIDDVYELITRVESGAPTEEVELRAENATRTLDSLSGMIGAGPTGSFNELARHLHFLVYYHRRDKPEGYAPDLQSLRSRDLPGVIAAVAKWGEASLDRELVSAISASWEAGQYGGAVRDAFIYLEEVLREVGNVPGGTGLSGERLVTSVLGPNSGVGLPADGPFGQLTTGEATGAYHMIRGAFLLVRNATAHRPIAYTAVEAEGILHLVDLCVRVVRGPAKT